MANTKGSKSIRYMRGELEFVTDEQKLAAVNHRMKGLIKLRNDQIRKLHAYYKYTHRELATIYRISRSGIGYILNSKEEFGDNKPCESCGVLLWQGHLDYRIWESKKYCSEYCKCAEKRERRKQRDNDGRNN